MINDHSKLPLNRDSITTSLLSSVNIKESDILSILKSLDANKDHGHDDISVRMLKMSSKSILNPLKLLFENCLQTGIFPDQWKKANIVPIHKKSDKQLLQIYRPVSLLPICGKFFERIIFNDLFKYFKEKNLLPPHQSGFIPGDSCVQQLIAIIHEIYKSYDCSPSLEVLSVFLDISKAFDKVWHDGLLYKLKCNGINGGLLKLIGSFLLDRHQRVVLNGQTSKWNKITDGVPQGSILGPLFFFKPQLVEILVIAIRTHLVKVYNNYASTLIIHKVNRHFSFLPITPMYYVYMSNQTNVFVLTENSKSVH